MTPSSIGKEMKKILLITCILLMTLIGCTRQIEKNYEDFDHMDHWDELNNLTEEETYLFYYSPFCKISQSIEDEVTDYFVVLEQRGVPIILIHEGMIFEQGEQPLEIIETPSILVYRDKVFIEIISGAKPVTQYLATKVND